MHIINNHYRSWLVEVPYNEIGTDNNNITIDHRYPHATDLLIDIIKCLVV